MARGWHGGASYDWGGVVAGQQVTPLTLTMDAGDTPSEFVAGLYTMESTTPIATLAVTVTSGLVVIDPTAAVATLDRGQYRWAGIADDVVWLSGTFEVLLVNSARGGSSSPRTLAVNVGAANTINVTLGTGATTSYVADAVDAEAVVRAAADTALDGRLDAIEGLATIVQPGDTAAATVAAINAAVASAAASGATVRLVPGETYDVPSPILLQGGVTFDCSGATLHKVGDRTPLMVNETWSGAGDPDITVIAHGATWAFDGLTLSGGSGEPYGALGDVVHFQRCDRLRICGRPTITGGIKYGMCIGNSDDIRIDGAHFDTCSDGVHLYPPMARASFGTFSGTTGDDFFALTIGDYTSQVANLTANGETVSTGDFTAITVEALLIANDVLPTGGTTYGSGLAMLSGSAAHRFRGIKVGLIAGKSQRAARLTNDQVLTATYLGDVTIDKIAVDRTGAYTPVLVDCSGVDSLHIGEIVSTVTTSSPVVLLRGSADTVTIGRFTQQGSCTSDIISIAAGSSISALHLRNVDVVLGANGRLVGSDASGTTVVTVDGFRLTGSSGWGCYVSTGTVVMSWLNGVFSGVGKVGRVDSPGVVTAFYDGVMFDGCTELWAVGGTLRATFGAISQTGSGDRGLFGAGTCSVSGQHFKVAHATINTPQTGDMVYSTTVSDLVVYASGAWARLARTDSGGAVLGAGVKSSADITVTGNDLGVYLRNSTNEGLSDSNGNMTVKAPGNVIINADSDNNGTGTVFVQSQGNNYMLAGPAYNGVMIAVSGSSSQRLGFHGTTPIVKQTGVAVTAAAIHAALVALGLIGA